MEENALARTLRRTGYGKVCGPVVKQTTEWLNERIHIKTPSLFDYSFI